MIQYFILYSSACVPLTAEGAEPGNGGAEGEGSETEVGCTDRDGVPVSEGAVYKPDADPCVQCTCREGRQTHCVTVMCQPPSCEWEPIEGECCQFRCLDANDNANATVHRTYLRFVIFTDRRMAR